MSAITATPTPFAPARPSTGRIVGSRHAATARAWRTWLARAAAALVVLLATAWLLAGGLADTSVAGDVVAAESLSVVIQPGDTVWDLAALHRPAGMSTQDYMMVVVTHNGVRATALQPGTVLELPRLP